MAIAWDQTTVVPDICGSVRCEPAWRLAPAWSARLHDFDLWLVWAGRGTMTLRGGRTLPLRPGVCLWMRPGGTYLAEHDPRQRLGVTFLHFDLLDRRGRRIAARRLPPEAHDLPEVAYADAVARRIVDLSTTHRPAAAALLRGLLMDLEAHAAAPRPRPRSPLEAAALDAAAAIRRSPADAPPVAALARAAHCSTDHFARTFRQVTGHSPQHYTVQARIDRARTLLRETALTVSQVADALGYRDVFFFSRQFTQKTGATPTAYRHA